MLRVQPINNHCARLLTRARVPPQTRVVGQVAPRAAVAASRAASDRQDLAQDQRVTALQNWRQE